MAAPPPSIEKIEFPPEYARSAYHLSNKHNPGIMTEMESRV